MKGGTTVIGVNTIVKVTGSTVPGGRHSMPTALKAIEKSTPAATPTSAPRSASHALSTKNIRKTSARVVPRARNVPISRVRSRNESVSTCRMMKKTRTVTASVKKPNNASKNPDSCS